MKGIAGSLVAAIVLALLGGIALTMGLLDRDLADAQQQISSLNYRKSDPAYEKAEHYFNAARFVPGIGNGPVNRMRARRAALKYWNRDLDGVVSGQTDSLSLTPPDNVDLQFVVATALLRSHQQKAKDKATSMVALDTGINAYRTVLRNATLNEDAAYNFEYLLRLKEDIGRGRRNSLPAFEPDPSGTGGFQLDDSEFKPNFKLYVPLDEEDREKRTGNAGKGTPKARKG